MRAPIVGLMLWGAAGCGLATVAAAQERPTIQPTRDVAVTYHITGEPTLGGPAQPNTPHEVRILYSAATHRMRVESEAEGRPSFAIMDRAHHSMIVVMPGQQRYMEMPLRGGASPTMMEDNPNLRFTRGGRETVAGLSCTEWKIADSTNPAHRGTTCITADGVMLRGSGSGKESGRGIVATKVEYGALPETLFSPPAGFQKMEIPGRPRR